MEENQHTDNGSEVQRSERSTHTNDALARKAAARRTRNNRLILFVSMAVLLALTEVVYFLDNKNALPDMYDSDAKPKRPAPAHQTPEVKTPNHETHDSYADSMSAHQQENAAIINENRANNALQNIQGATPAASPNTSTEDKKK